MLKIKTDNSHIEMEICGSLTEICSELAQILNAIKDRMTENNPALGHKFKVIFTKGFMDGAVFQEDREHMEHYLAEGDERCGKSKNPKEATVEMLNNLIEFLRDKSTEMKEVKKELDKMLKEEEKGNSDEAK